ncbi:MAG: hypothetical protein OXU61_03715 [Gammaproteobacteria bacterium]|nr:hypothetical protein [Gammaproteobacteria bacterium]MDD9824160.1 hypothetical protein [Gammaproteobacteria bacterium]MDD9863139.1 hypothetical protein [Gammaproteobacteria bacterium]
MSGAPRPGTGARGRRALYAVCAALLLLEFGGWRHGGHAWEGLWGFYSLFGFVACVALVLSARLLRRAVMRSEDYYERE